MAEGAEQVEAGLAQVESGVEGVFKLLALVDAGQLLGFGRQLRLGVRARMPRRCRVPICVSTRLQLLVGDLLLQAGDLGLGIQFAQAAGERGDLDIVLALGLLGLDLGAQGLGGGDLGLGAQGEVEEAEW